MRTKPGQKLKLYCFVFAQRTKTQRLICTIEQAIFRQEAQYRNIIKLKRNINSNHYLIPVTRRIISIFQMRFLFINLRCLWSFVSPTLLVYHRLFLCITDSSCVSPTLLAYHRLFLCITDSSCVSPTLLVYHRLFFSLSI